MQGVIDMIGHLGKYQRQAASSFVRGKPVLAPVNVQEIKQVVLNLLTNALDSVEEEGVVRIELAARDGMAELTRGRQRLRHGAGGVGARVRAFFTRRRAGQGTGLGLSIAHRIVADHGGAIEAHSDGPGRGAVFRVRLPLGRAPQGNRGHAAAGRLEGEPP